METLQPTNLEHIQESKLWKIVLIFISRVFTTDAYYGDVTADESAERIQETKLWKIVTEYIV